MGLAALGRAPALPAAVVNAASEVVDLVAALPDEVVPRGLVDCHWAISWSEAQQEEA